MLSSTDPPPPREEAPGCGITQEEEAGERHPSRMPGVLRSPQKQRPRWDEVGKGIAGGKGIAVKDDGWRLENRLRALGPWRGAGLWGGGGRGVSDGGAFPRKLWPGCPGVLEPVSCENGSALGPPPSKVIGWEPLWAAWPWCGRAGDPRSICHPSAHFHGRCTNIGGTSGGLRLGAPRPPLLQLLTPHALMEPQRALTERPYRCSLR